jgi:hypothetical protein
MVGFISGLCAPRHTRRRPGRKDAESTGPPPVSPGTHPLHGRGTRPSEAGHPHLRRRRPILGFRRGVRREEVPGGGISRASWRQCAGSSRHGGRLVQARSRVSARRARLRGRRLANKVYTGPAAALEGLLFDGMTIMCGGFGLCCNPEGSFPRSAEAGQETSRHVKQRRSRMTSGSTETVASSPRNERGASGHDSRLRNCIAWAAPGALATMCIRVGQGLTVHLERFEH